MTSQIDALPKPEAKQGEQVSFVFGFDKEKLAQLDPESMADRERWGYEEKVANARSVLEVYGRLPEGIRFEPGITAIFGENGQGKTLLADVVVMAVQMEQFRQKNGIARDQDILKKDPSGESENRFYPVLPGTLNSSPHSNLDEQDAHAMFVATIAQCADVSDLVLHDPNKTVGAAMRTPAALGNIAMGMSSRQAVDMLESMSSRRRKNPSIHIYDEPELGMSPRRHRDELLPMLLDRANDGSVELVPSNSIVLFESSAPRIDLAFPEQGITTPEV